MLNIHCQKMEEHKELNDEIYIMWKEINFLNKCQYEKFASGIKN